MKQESLSPKIALFALAGEASSQGEVPPNRDHGLPDLKGFSMLNHGVEILLVEDNPSDVKLALHAFQKHHLADQVHVVRDGAEALEFIFCTDRYSERQIENGPKVVLLDLKLPLVDGIEVLRRMKNDSRTQMIPVVIMTSSTEEKDIEKSYRLGVNSYIVKPVNFDQFTEVVRHLGFYWLMLNQRPPMGE